MTDRAESDPKPTPPPPPPKKKPNPLQIETRDGKPDGQKMVEGG